MRDPIKVIDLFAGPGGLAEGFGRFRESKRESPSFKIAISVERDAWAHQTLHLRSFFRQFSETQVPEAYYDYLRGEISRECLLNLYPKEAAAASAEALHAELGTADNEWVYARIDAELKDRTNKHWVLIGGPPCQAYSVIGRSRMRSMPGFENDRRHSLYKEYLSILARFRPSIFIMENVKGLLSAKFQNQPIFERILRDLGRPSAAMSADRPGYKPDEIIDKAPDYHIYSLVVESRKQSALDPNDFVIRTEEYGIPQTRHRVILLGVREDITRRPRTLDPQSPQLNASDVLSGMPELRSHLSKNPLNLVRDPSVGSWLQAISTITESAWFQRLGSSEEEGDNKLHKLIIATLSTSRDNLTTGGEFVRGVYKPRKLADWYMDSRLNGVCNHTSRGHLAEDLHRYLFAACFTQIYGYSPKMRDFPTDLLPQHKNILASRASGAEDDFDDRFRVQVAGRPATTITCHISKDGHYNIHFDPKQCRSLTVREAARLQTFPDNYFIEGPRTQQYLQVGNAVPPLLAMRIAELAKELIPDEH